EIEIVAEERLWRHRLRDLHERAIRTEHEIERVHRFRLRKLLLGEKRVRQRRLPERENQMKIGAATGATCRFSGHACSAATGVALPSDCTQASYQAMVSIRPASSE